MYFSKLVTCYAVVMPLSRRRAALPLLVTLPIKAAANEGERQKTKMFMPAALSHCREDAYFELDWKGPN